MHLTSFQTPPFEPLSLKLNYDASPIQAPYIWLAHSCKFKAKLIEFDVGAIKQIESNEAAYIAWLLYGPGLASNLAKICFLPFEPRVLDAGARAGAGI